MQLNEPKIRQNYDIAKIKAASPKFISTVRDLSIMLVTRATQDLKLRHGILGDLGFLNTETSGYETANLEAAEEIVESNDLISEKINAKFKELKNEDESLFEYLDAADKQPSFFSQIDKTLGLFYKILISIHRSEFNMYLQDDKNRLSGNIILFENNLEILKLKLRIWGIKLEDIFVNGQTQQFKILHDFKNSLRDPKYNLNQ